MKESFNKILREYDSLARELAETKSPDVIKKLGRQQASLALVVEKIRELEKVENDLRSLSSLSASSDADMRELAENEQSTLTAKKSGLEKDIEEALLPRDPLDEKGVIMEIRAAAGGDEAALFASELFRMYNRYAESRGWRTSLISESRNELGGFKEIIFEITGDHVYGHLRYESGVHRVQRVPITEKSGRVHTSTVTVAVLPQIPEDEFKIAPSELKIETSTSRGAGGQSVNTTYSAIKITHLPTGIMATSQDERSQIQNRAKALQVLTSRVFAHYEEKKMKELTQKRRSQIGTGDRSEKIRTYNFPQDRITDHRINENFKQVSLVLEGKLDPIISALAAAQRQLLELSLSA